MSFEQYSESTEYYNQSDQLPLKLDSEYYNYAYYRSLVCSQQRNDTDDILTRFKDYYDLFASKGTKRLVNLLLFICYAISLTVLWNAMIWGVPNLITFSVYFVFGILLTTTKQEAFSLVLAFYSVLYMVFLAILFSFSLKATIYIPTPYITMLVKHILLLILCLVVTFKLKVVKKDFKQCKYIQADQ